MPTLKTPLFGSYNNRSFAAVSGKDQFFKGCVLTPIANAMTRSAAYYVEKRTGLVSFRTPSSGNLGAAVYSSPSLPQKTFSIFLNGSNYELFQSTVAADVNCGIIGTDGVFNITETSLSGTVTYLLITCCQSSTASTATGQGWVLASDATSNTAYTCDGNNSTTITDIKVSGVNSVAGLYVGQKLTAASNIVAGSRIVSINAGAFSAVLDTATTGGAFNDLATTKEPVAKIIDADFPTNIVGGFVELNGYVNIMTIDRRVYQSDSNNVFSWGASNYLTCDKNSGFGRGIFKYKSMIAAFVSTGVEFLTNAGNASGSTMASSSVSSTGKTSPPIHALSCALANDSLYWIGADNNIYTLEGYASKKISTLGTSINTNAAGDPVVTSFTYNKKSFLNIALTISSTTNYWYCIDDNTWADSALTSGVVRATYDASFQNFFLTGNTDGKVYTLRDELLGSSAFQDNGSAFTMSIQIGTDMGTQKRKIYTQLRILADVQASGTLDVSWCDVDDGSTYTTARSIPLTDINQMFLTRLGSGKGIRLWKFEHSANTACRIKGIEIDYDVVNT